MDLAAKVIALLEVIGVIGVAVASSLGKRDLL